MIENYEAASPAEIDAVLADAGRREAVARERVRSARDYVRRYENEAGYGNMIENQRRYADEHQAVAEAARAEQEPGEAEYDRRGGWERGFLVQNVGGHLHRTMNCSTCRFTTRFGWMTEVSGLTEQEIVERAGERACTVCYPSAPVEVLARPSQLSYDVEQRAAAAERDAEKARKAAAKAEKALANPDGSEIKLSSWTSARTIIAGQRVLADRFYTLGWYGDHPSAADWRSDIEIVAAALAHKLGGDVEAIKAEAKAKADKRVAKDKR